MLGHPFASRARADDRSLVSPQRRIGWSLDVVSISIERHIVYLLTDDGVRVISVRARN
jgi:hypothetical protein